MPNKVQLIISLKELAVIREIRKTSFGVIRVNLKHGDIDYISTERTEKITEKSGLDSINETDARAIVSDGLLIEKSQVSIVFETNGKIK